MKTPSILLVVTSATRMGEVLKPTGAWLEEVVAPYYTFIDARCEVTVASPRGGLVPLDGASLKPENATASTRRYDADHVAQQALAATVPLAQIDAAAYDAVYFAGGHGTMVDFPTDANVRRVVEAFYAVGKPLASVCHGPACLVNAYKPDGSPLVAGHRFTCFSDAEEIAVGQESQVPFMLESRLSSQGGKAEIAPLFTAHTVADGALLTGQNPASSIPLAERVIHELRQVLKDAA